MYYKPSVVDYDKYQFLIMSAPDDSNMSRYIKDMKDYKVTLLMRTWDISYTEDKILDEGIDIKELSFSDGSAPPKGIIEEWIKIVKEHFSSKNKNQGRIGIHWVAGLGRAPVLVGVALLEFGLDNELVVKKLRKERPGALNHAQTEFLLKYTPKSKCWCIIF